MLALLLPVRVALADRVDDLIRGLKSSDAKARLSAVLNLGKLGDKRAIMPLVGALHDDDKTVRAVASAALGKLVDATVDVTTRNKAIDALQRVAKSDPEPFVRTQAQKAYDAVKALRGVPGGAGPGPTLDGKAAYVEIGPLHDASGSAAAQLPGLRKTVEKSLPHDFATGWPAGRQPSTVELDRAKLHAFYVDGTVNKIEVQKTPAGATVRCWVSMLAAEYTGNKIVAGARSAFAFANMNKAEVDAAGNSEADIDEAKQVCLEELVKGITKDRLVTAIKVKI
jgi:hypothetical protein